MNLTINKFWNSMLLPLNQKKGEYPLHSNWIPLIFKTLITGLKSRVWNFSRRTFIFPRICKSSNDLFKIAIEINRIPKVYNPFDPCPLPANETTSQFLLCNDITKAQMNNQMEQKWTRRERVLIKQGEKYDLSRAITAGLPTSTGRNMVRKNAGIRRKNVYKVEVRLLKWVVCKKKIRDILPPLCFRLWRRHRVKLWI